MEVPVTTIYDRLRTNEKRFVKKHTTLLDFTQLGFLAKAHIAIKVEKDSREELRQFLLEKPNINSLYRTNFHSDFLAEAIFRNTAELQNFKEEIERRFKPIDISLFHVIDELKKENFLTKPEHFEEV
jgi:DNA-binding Lrp family transcriptional regulator